MKTVATLATTVKFDVVEDAMFLQTLLAEVFDGSGNDYRIAMAGSMLVIDVNRAEYEPLKLLLKVENLCRQIYLALNDSER